MKVSKKELERIRELDPCFGEMNDLRLRKLIAAIVLELSHNGTFLRTAAILSILNSPRRRSVEKRLKACEEIRDEVRRLEECDSAQKQILRRALMVPLTKRTTKVAWKDIVGNAPNKAGKYSRSHIFKYRDYFYHLKKERFLKMVSSYWSLGLERMRIPKAGIKDASPTPQYSDAEETVAAPA